MFCAEACIRSGLDPAELLSKPKSLFHAKSLTKEMIDIKYNAFEHKRKGSVKLTCTTPYLTVEIPEKIALVKAERATIIQFMDRMMSKSRSSPVKELEGSQQQTKPSNMLEMVCPITVTCIQLE